ncbi:putative Rieske 2Fe-2S iron-sulfur protein YhfW [Lentibacillus sp. JNUCC-1]|uniref:FAD-dependent oxidoreductase n=1 Tax=Lentibacillus sp. JNUCC-1 TaxID=2654513 RepID=UPI001329F455|nr:FAD-dependent oxidoreductase [Lentibacillus sp. JNUCC-1]MUV39837.1 putative Rieske 2Fe-2S iron-sulfur protein YhfW [Lentibacillus sp. JNUCC-1]
MSTKLTDNVQSYWHKIYQKDQENTLQEDIQTDVVVAGGGIAGVMSAYFLAKSGKRVALLEARELYSGTTGFTTAKLTAQHNLIYDEMINRYGQKTAQQYYQANMEGIAFVKELANQYGIDCDLEEQDAFVFTEQIQHKDKLKKEYDAYQKLGIEGAFVEDLPLDLDISAAVMMRHQAQFHPVKFLQGIVKEIKALGGYVFEHTPVMDLSVDKQVTCHTDSDYTVTADDVVLATHLPVYEPGKKFYSSHVKTESSYALAVKSSYEFPEGMYINNDLPKRTLRSIRDNGENYLLVGGESHPTGDGKSSKERYEQLVKFAESHFGDVEVLNHWSSHDYIAPDRIPFIGQLHEDTDHVYTLTAFGKWGLAAAVTGGKVITDLIQGDDNPYAALFAPNRQINKITETEPKDDNPTESYDKSSQASDPKQLSPGMGSIVKIDDKNVAAYKDNNGQLHLLDTACTHLGCDVAWNDGDKTWDCPCHGSRFAATGEVIEGPAVKDMPTWKK